MKLRYMGWLVALISVLPSVAEASLADKKKQKEQEEYLQKEVESADKACETKLKVSLAWKTFTMADLEEFSAYGFCDTALNSLETVCGDADGKAAVQKQVKQVVCKQGKKRNITLKKGVLELTIEWAATNYEPYVREFLMKTLE